MEKLCREFYSAEKPQKPRHTLTVSLPPPVGYNYSAILLVHSDSFIAWSKI